jgi:hypothetical protein
MTDSVRKHARIEQKEYPGVGFEIPNLFTKPVQVFVPQKSVKSKSFDLLIHFHGAGYVTGYAAIRRILSSESNYAKVDAVLLLDGIHASYIPDRKVLAEGGRIDSTGLFPFIKLASDAASKKSRKRFLISHSEIFPGTFVSTTEATDYLLSTISVERKPVLKWGPLGMQQLTSARKNRLEIMGFAGNTARDHVDHVQALYWFLNQLHGL